MSNESWNMAEDLSRKKRVRSAHRASVTKTIKQVYDNLSRDRPNSPILRQQKASLAGTRDLLMKLDEELLELVDEGELEDEVEKADEIQEKIGLTVIDIDHALCVRSPSPK